MTLPPSYHTAQEYLSETLNFFKTFSWLYNYSNTHILVKRITKCFPIEWILYFKKLSYCELVKLLEGETTDDCPISLKSLINLICKLKPNNTVYSTIYNMCIPNLVHNSGLSRKKLHEIVSLAPLIDNVCKQNGVNIVIDIGAGLGYCSHLLHDTYKYNVLGIECSTEYIELALNNQQKYYQNSKDHVKFVQHYINKHSSDKITDLVEKYFSNISEKVVCIAGLHACADLSITILDLFTKLDFVKCLVIMPCCYHRIQLENITEEREYFRNFPVSKMFKESFQEFEAENFITRPFLRLACQQSMKIFKDMTVEDHEQHSRNCMYRAILQEVVELENCKVRRLKRKSGKSIKLQTENHFEAYLDNLIHTHQLEYKDSTKGEKLEISNTKFQQKMIEKWNEHKDDCFLIEILTGFQASIQSICENFVLLDRVEFLKEQGFECSIQKVTDDAISPRCFALVTSKV